MKILKHLFKIGYLLFLSIGLSDCKKETKIIDNPNVFGTIFGKGDDQSLSGVIQTKDSHFILWGTTNLGENGSFDGFVMKVDENFNTLWYKNFGGNGEETLEALALDDEDNMMLVGSSNSLKFVNKDSTVKFKQTQSYVLYLNQSGDLLWDTAISTNANKNNYNYSIYSHKILFLKNNTFCIAATTTSFFTNLVAAQTEDVYAFAINKKSKILWTGRYYEIWTKLQKIANEHCTGLIQTGNGDIIFQLTTHANSQPNGFFSNLIKIPMTGPKTFENDWILETDVVNNPGSEQGAAMTIISNDNIIMYDYSLKALNFLNTLGEFTGQVLLKKSNIYISDIYENNNQLFLIKRRDPLNVDLGKPGWIFCDMKGNVQMEKDIELENVELNKVFVNSKNEILAFGTITHPNRTDIIMLRYNEHGTLIK